MQECLLFLLHVYLCVYVLCVHIPLCICGGQTTTLGIILRNAIHFLAMRSLISLQLTNEGGLRILHLPQRGLLIELGS